MINRIENFSAQKTYKYITDLKRALGINSNKEVSLSVILELVQEQNKKEFFLLKYIIEQINSMPKEIKDAYSKLIESEDSVNYKKTYKQTELMYKKNPVFLSFYKKIYIDIEFDIKNSVHFFNSVIYELIHKELSSNHIFSYSNPIMNLYYVQKWLKKYEDIPLIKLTKNENQIISLLSEGLTEEEIKSLNLVKLCGKEKIQSIIETTLPKKYGADNIMQVLAIRIFKF